MLFIFLHLDFIIFLPEKHLIKLFCSKIYSLFNIERFCWYVRDRQGGLYVTGQEQRFLGQRKHSPSCLYSPHCAHHCCCCSWLIAPCGTQVSQQVLMASSSSYKQSVPLNILHVGWATEMQDRHQIMYHVSCLIPDFFRTGPLLHWDNHSTAVCSYTSLTLQLMERNKEYQRMIHLILK